MIRGECDDCGETATRYQVWYVCDVCGKEWANKLIACENCVSSKGYYKVTTCDCTVYTENCTKCNGTGRKSNCSYCGDTGVVECEECSDGYLYVECTHGKTESHYYCIHFDDFSETSHYYCNHNYNGVEHE